MYAYVIMLPPPWVLCWHIHICRGTIRGKICIKLVPLKIFWMNFFCLVAVFSKGIHWKVNRKHCNNISYWDWYPLQMKRKKHQKLSAVGLSFDLNVSSQGVNEAGKMLGEISIAPYGKHRPYLLCNPWILSIFKMYQFIILNCSRCWCWEWSSNIQAGKFIQRSATSAARL